MTQKILVIEDDRSTADFLVSGLTESGFCVDAFVAKSTEANAALRRGGATFGELSCGEQGTGACFARSRSA